MYISQIRLNDVRCFAKDFVINLERNGEPILWTSILGNNATGKTTLLRSIAIGLCDESSAAGLLKESDQGYIRRDEHEATVDLELRSLKDPQQEISITTTITKTVTKDGHSFEQLRQKTEPPEPERFPWDDLFVCAYGTGRSVSGTGDVAGYSVINAVYNMFSYSEGLQNPELAFRRMGDQRQHNLRSSLRKVLNLGSKQEIKLTSSGFTIDGDWGKEMPLRDLADGYKSTFYWVTDLWGWAVSHDPTISMSKEISGVVLIDELEQHLHPKWQRYVIGYLRKQFPKVQFIVTTHSPLIALGTADIDNATIVALKLESENRVMAREEEAKDYRGMRVDQVLTSIFELPIARSGDTGDQILQFQELFARDDLDEKEQIALEHLRDSVIKDLPEVVENVEDKKIRKEVLNLLAKLENDSGKSRDK